MKRKLALALAFALIFTSVPASSLTGLAEEILILEDEGQDEEIDGVDFTVSETVTVSEDVAVPEEEVLLLIEEVEEAVVENGAEVSETETEEMTEIGETEGSAEGSDLMGDFLIEDPETEAIQEQETQEEEALDLGSDEEEESSFWIEDCDDWEEVFPGTPETVRFYVEAYSENDAELSYQWYYEGEVTEESETYTDWIKMDNETSYELILENVQAPGKYLCEVSDGINTESVECTVMFNSVVVEKQYNKVEANETGAAELKVNATSVLEADITYTWKTLTEIDDEVVYVEIEGAGKSNSYTVDYNKDGNNTYYCFVSDGNAETFVEFIVVPYGAPILEISPRYEVDFGGNVALEAKVITNADDVAYQWYFCGPLWNEYDEPVKLADETGETLKLTNVTTVPGTMDSDYSNLIYKCVVTKGEYTTSVSTLVHVNYKEDSLYVYGYGTKKVKPGDAVTLGFSRIDNTGGELSFQWYQWDKDGNQVKLENQTGKTLKITAPTEPGDYNYSCLVCNGKDYDTLLCYLNVGTRLSIKPLINGVNVSEYQASPEEKITLSVEAASDASNESITYRWFSEDDEEAVLGTHASLEVTVNEGKYYYCEVKDGTNTGSVEFQINLPPFMIIDTTHVMEVEEGEEQPLSVYVYKYFSEDDDIVLCYRWQKYTASTGWENVPDEEMKLKVDDSNLVVAELTTDQITETTTYRFSVWDDCEEWEDSIEYIIKVEGTDESKYGIVAVDKENAFSINVGDTMQALIPYTGAQAWFKFVPTTTGEYILPTKAGDKYIYTYVHDEYGNMSPSYDIYSETMNVELEAGRTYYLQAGFHATANEGFVTGWLPYQITAADHSCNWNNGVVTKAPTCTTTGVKTYTCTDPKCGKTYTEDIAALGHSYGEEQTLETDSFTKIYTVCQTCETEKLISMTAKDAEEQDKITAAEDAMDALENGASADVSAAVDAVISMDNQLLIDMEESTAEGTDTAMKLVEDLEAKLLTNSTGITGTIAASEVKVDVTDSSVDSQKVEVSGAAVTVAAVLKAAEGTNDAPDANTEYKAELAITETTDSSVEDGVYSIDISLDIVATGSEGTSTFAENVQPAAPLYITMSVPESFWNCEFELLHNGTKVNFVRNADQTISFYAASLSPWTIEVTKCPDNAHKYEVSAEKSVASTCQEEGKTVSVCKRCGDEISKTEAKKAHNWTAWKTVTEVSCTEKGVQERICSNSGCGEKDKKELSSLGGHKWKTVVDKAAGCAVAGSQHRECSVCSAKEAATTIPATGKHNYGSYQVTKAATVVAEGWEEAKCANCASVIGRTVKKTIPELSLQVKKTFDLKQVVTGLAKGVSIKSWKPDNTKVATVSKQGKVSAKKVGTAKITVTLTNGKTGEVIVHVQKKAVKTTSLTVNKKDVKLEVGGKFELKVTKAPLTSFEKVTYKTSKKSVATVNSKGKITAKKPGKATITVKSGNKSEKVSVTVLAPELKGITNVPATKTLTFKKTKSFTLKPKLKPAKATGKITYQSSDTSIATVSSKGKVKAKKRGTVTITVTAGKFKKTCKVTIK